MLARLQSYSDSGDYQQEIYLINILAHYLQTDLHSLDLKRFVLQEATILRQKTTSTLLQEQLQKSL